MADGHASASKRREEDRRPGLPAALRVRSTIRAVKDARTLAVILAVFIAVATLATLLSMPAFEMAKGESEFVALLAVVWAVFCYVVCARAGLSVLDAYRKSVRE